MQDTKTTTGQRKLAIRRAMYSAMTLSVVGGVVAVLGAPLKWSNWTP